MLNFLLGRGDTPITTYTYVGSVDKRQMETLMTHGLTPEEAVDVIVKGVLA